MHAFAARIRCWRPIRSQDRKILCRRSIFKMERGAIGVFCIADLAVFPLFGLALGIFGLVPMPLSNAYPRWREPLAAEVPYRRRARGFSRSNGEFGESEFGGTRARALD
jgi:hypothetical protein